MDNDYEKAALKVPIISIFANLSLALIKLIFGLAAHSGALVSDSVHSAADVFSDIVVMLGVKLSAKEPDEEHPYGHERFESVAAVVLAVILIATGLAVGYAAIRKLWGNAYAQMQTPGIAALIAAAGCVVGKEALYRYARFCAVRLDSGALMAEALHHRSDALASAGALIGILGVKLGFAWLDAAASLLICGFILENGFSVFADAIRKMVDHACDEKLRAALWECAVSQQGVLRVKSLQTREFGSKVYADLEINADNSLTLSEAGRIAEQVHSAAEKQFPKLKHINVRVSPD